MRDNSLEKLSELLPRAADEAAKRTIMRLWGDYIRTLRAFRNKTKNELEIIEDYNQVKKGAKIATISEETVGLRDGSIDQRNLINESVLQAIQPYLAQNVGRVNLSELVIKPDTFNGLHPKPRDWIEHYEEAFIANDWSETTAMKYCPTFLRGSALDWYKCMVRPRNDSLRKWDEMKRAPFERHYLGKDEMRR